MKKDNRKQYMFSLTRDELNRVITCLETSRREKQELCRACYTSGHIWDARRLEREIDEINSAIRSLNAYKIAPLKPRYAVNKTKARKMRAKEEYLDWHLELMNGSTWIHR